MWVRCDKRDKDLTISSARDRKFAALLHACGRQRNFCFIGCAPSARFQGQSATYAVYSWARASICIIYGGCWNFSSDLESWAGTALSPIHSNAQLAENEWNSAHKWEVCNLDQFSGRADLIMQSDSMHQWHVFITVGNKLMLWSNDSILVWDSL